LTELKAVNAAVVNNTPDAPEKQSSGQDAEAVANEVSPNEIKLQMDNLAEAGGSSASSLGVSDSQLQSKVSVNGS